MSLVRKLPWLWQRLRVMSAGEIAYRLRAGFDDGVARLGERFAPAGWPALSTARSSAAFLTIAAPQLFQPPYQRNPADEQRLLAGELPVFGHWVPVRTGPEFWHTDPLFQVVWPQLPYRQIDYRPGNATGDVRIVWDANRLQHLFALAMIAHHDPAQREAAVRRIESDLQTWYSANPPGIGVNYLSAMEEALRLVSLFHAYDLVRQWVSAETRLIVAGIAAQHTSHIERRLSLYSSAGNHTIAEATGLLYAGILLPEYPGAARWRETGRRLLRVEAARQIDADGGGIEQATWYLLFITDLLGLAQALLAHRGEAPEPAIDAALLRSRSFLNALASGPDDLPKIGDADDGFALSPGLRISWQANGPTRIAHSYPVAGLSLDRDPEKDCRLIFLHNPLGMAPGYGHGHADCLSLIFRHAGVDLLIDPGTYMYGGAREYRSYFRSAAGHNTATVDGADHAEQAGAFLWREPYQPKLLQADFDADGCVLLARHDAFRKQGVTHHRGVVYRPGRFLAVWDHFDGAEGHDVRLHWHLGCAPASCDLADGRVELAAGSERFPLEISGATVTLAESRHDPLLGWQSRYYGSLDQCVTVELKADLAASSGRVLTILWLGEPEPLAILDPLLAGFAARITVQT
jgi:hypothetical protein